MGYQITDWRQGDSENVMLGKLLQKFGGMPMPGDSIPTLLRKLLDIVANAEDSPSPTPSGSLANFKDGPGNADARVYNTNGALEVARFSGGSFSVLAGAISATGNISSSGGALSAAGNITSTAGNIAASAGTLSASGNITTTAGSLIANAGDLTLSSGKATITSPSLAANAPGVTINQTWNNVAAPLFVGLDVNVTDSASPTGNAALLIRGVVNTADVFRVRKDGTVYGMRFTGLSTSSATSHTISDAGTTNAPTLLLLTHDTSGTPAADFGGTIEFQAESTTTVGRTQSKIQSQWTDAADGTRTAKLDFYTILSGSLTRGMSLLGTQLLFADGTVSLPSHGFINETNSGLYRASSGVFNFTIGGAAITSLSNTALVLTAAEALRWGSSGVTSPDVSLYRDAANVLAQRNTTNTQTLRVYNTYTDGTNYERLALQTKGAVIKSMNLAAETQGSGDDNLWVLLTPAGTGGLYLGPVADSGVGGGNARGTKAVDLQIARNAATMVASGAYSVIGGGYWNTASGSESVTCGGINNNASATRSAILGGESNAASGEYSAVLGGQWNAAQGNFSSAKHVWAKAYRFGQAAQASFRYSTGIGEAQTSVLTAGRVTTDDTPLLLYLDGDGATYPLVIPTDYSWSYRIMVVARINQDGFNTTDAWEIYGAIKNVAGVVTDVGTPVVTKIADESTTWTVTIAANDTTNTLDITVTGAADTIIRWSARIELCEVFVEQV